MGIKHKNCDVGAEMDQFRVTIDESATKITSDTHDEKNNRTTVEYVCAEGDPPFIHYRLTLEAIGHHSEEEYEQLVEVKPAGSTDEGNDE